MTQAYIKTVKTPKKMVPKINFNHGNFNKSENKPINGFGDSLSDRRGGQTQTLVGLWKFSIGQADVDLSTGMLEQLNMSTDRFQSPSFSANPSNSLISKQFNR